MKENDPTNPRRKYSSQFKREAVKHWLTSGKSAQAIATELGVGAERLYEWKQRFSPVGPQEAEDLQAQWKETDGCLAALTRITAIVAYYRLLQPIEGIFPGKKDCLIFLEGGNGQGR